MDKLEPLQAFSFDSNVSHSWKLWLKHFDFYLAVTEKDTKGDKDFHFSHMHCSKRKRNAVTLGKR